MYAIVGLMIVTRYLGIIGLVMYSYKKPSCRRGTVRRTVSFEIL